MPIVESSLLDCALYVYPSEKAAREGLRAGGSGFLVGVPMDLPDWWTVYAVTNKHVLDSGNHVLRLNTKAGAFDTMATDPSEWTVSLEDDVAVRPVHPTDHFRFNLIPTSLFVREDDNDFAVGDDAVLIGRLVTHEGRQKNKPIARFGNLAMLADPEEPIRISGGHHQVAYLVDCRSLSGTSGSAVLGYRNPHRGNTLVLGGNVPVLLGIDCAHLPFWTPVCAGRDRATAIPDMWVESNSGIAVVIPAWRIKALLDEPHLVETRRTKNETLVAEQRQHTR